MNKENGERLHTDLELSDYLKYPASQEEIKAGLESWMREAMIMPFAYKGTIENGRFVSFGQSMVTMAEHGLSERMGQVGQARAEADLTGLKRIEGWLREEAANGDLMVLLSPPGSEEEGFGANGQRRLSFTHLGRVNVVDGVKEIRIVSLPEKEVAIPQHVWRLHAVWGDAVALWLRTVEKTDKGLVATPLFISERFVGDSLDRYAQMQGKKGWGEVENELLKGLTLKEDEKAEERRRSLIDTITWQIRRYVDERDSSRLRNIGLVARVVMAREAAGKYLNWEPEQLINEYDEIETAKWYQEQMKKKSLMGRVGEWLSNGAEAAWAWGVLSRLQDQLSRETDVQEMLLGSSCGGGGLDEFVGEGEVGRIGSKSYFDNLMNEASGNHKGRESSVATETLKCVKCPFCHKTVDAIVTPSRIKCPACKKEVSKG